MNYKSLFCLFHDSLFNSLIKLYIKYKICTIFYLEVNWDLVEMGLPRNNFTCSVL